jgi:peptidoglycan lytic transglycosylase D
LNRLFIILLWGFLLPVSQFSYGGKLRKHKEEASCVNNIYLDKSFIADLLSCQQSDIPLTFHPKIYGFIDYFVNRNRDYTQMVISRSQAYFPIFEEEFEKTGLPQELKYLAIVESGLNPKAYSRVGAGGLWQFMPATGRMFGLNRDNLIDDRFDPYLSTVAAAKYLGSLYKQFKNWELALAAYNCGPGKVRRAIRRSGYKRDFWLIYPYLPRETRNYLPQYVAFAYIMENYRELGFSDDELEYLPEFETIQVSQNIDLSTFSQELQSCLEDMEKLNPQIKKGLVPIQRKNYSIRIPKQCKAYFEKNSDSILVASSNLNEKQTHLVATYDRTSTYGKENHKYRVRSGDVLGTIAEKYHVRVSDLRKWNNLRSNMIRVGQRLSVWKAPGYQVQKYPPKKVVDPKPIPGSKVHVVKYGDTLWDISKLYEGLSIDKIKTLNNLKTSRIKPGQRLRIG